MSSFLDRFEIRPLTEFDVISYWQLRLRALKDEPQSFGESYDEAVESNLSDVAKRLNSTDNSFVLGAFAPGLVGAVGLQSRKGIKLRHTAVIWGMYVAPEGRGQGVGRALLQSAIARAALMADIKQIILTVVTINEAARNLYLSMGFQSYGVEPDALKVKNTFYDEELMRFTLLKP